MVPLLSVIVPVYNGEQTIENCIRSILCQTLKQLEIIVINDGSTDGTERILKSIDDGRVRIITVPNGGQGVARNIGIEVAKGRYIGFVDADDTISPEMYKKMCDCAEKYSADMVQCAINDIKNDKVTTRPDTASAFEEITDPADYVRKRFYTLEHTNEVCNKIFRRGFITGCGVKFSDTRIVYSEDLKFNIDVLSHLGRVCFMNDGLYNYNISDDGHCLKNPVRRFEGIFRLYTLALESITNRDICRCIKSMAVINLMSYAVDICDIDGVKKIVNSKKMKGYMFSSLLYKKTVPHTLLMLALMCLPYAMKRRIIKKHYVFD